MTHFALTPLEVAPLRARLRPPWGDLLLTGLTFLFFCAIIEMLRNEKRVKTSTSTARFFFLNPSFNKTCRGQEITNNIQTYVRSQHGDRRVSEWLYYLCPHGQSSQRKRRSSDGVPSRADAGDYPHLLRTNRSLVRDHCPNPRPKRGSFFM